MDLTQDNIASYLQPLMRRPHPHLVALEADAAARSVPIIGPWEGQVLGLLARSIQARHLLELGTATGYSAMWLAAVTTAWDGHVTTIDQDPTRVREAQEHIDAAGLTARVRILHGAALASLQNIPGPFDMIFNDILYYLQTTEEAHQLLDACLQRLRPGGLFLCDNALRGGRVMDTSSNTATLATKAFTEALLHHPQLDTALIPIRDGLLVCRKHDS